MIDFQTFFLFFPVALLLALSPGPDNLFVLAQSAQHGRPAGFAVTIGLCTGLIGHTLAVAFGLAAVVKASALAFTVLKIAGALYLLWLAWQAWRAGGEVGESNAHALSGIELYRRGMVMNLTNPKVSLFFLAFLPQFTDPRHGSMTMQFIELGALFILATLIVFAGLSMVAGGLGERFRRSPAALRLVNRAAAMIFTGLAIKLAITER
ncbi:MAG TPA: LysE family translocator [Chlorobaculum sp.]|uniref:Amino acid efflux protein, putative n=1 Tax=Chlorobaculum tepidum (strain ATCC 49652 / DSM 12025 / NBRC 103806 / TLS) TaxID=194439 RepID=Q8KCZ0_CHLTE|nr:LysE family translocator [Chlorobaculum tepidum]AAM72497.1 amino acid efflux protein, putative [Chlorobaculum tepidum TLS]HBU23578.1 LysE family translocator [Chlorobaculum sp.]